ncbi:hypothetical protein [Dyadobacter luticola]|uniref:Uncharacterized protein n=1 Tax=Dyadobacter luticola TaxID=1979387 RepID=A0A5R9L1I5_9BACT|nr:hypothetical protein [Dyadobacter luticola]TLV02422.1 hypothetical protein FEN17_01955 [Dyadobacter luticola]
MAILLTALAISCADHDITEPESNCERADGTPRLYPCEFEIVKAEFAKGLTINDIFATITPQNPDVVLPMQFAWYRFSQNPNTIDITFKIKLYVKRIANASVHASSGYILDKPTGWPSTIASLYSTAFFPPLHPQVPIELLSLPLGETTVVISDAAYHIMVEYLPPLNTPVYTKFTGNVLYAFHNIETTKVLTAAPYDYSLGVDASEAHIVINPAITE